MPRNPDADSGRPAPGDEFSRMAEESSNGAVTELWAFLMTNKKWWLAPIVIILALVAALLLVVGPAAPFIYPLF